VRASVRAPIFAAAGGLGLGGGQRGGLTDCGDGSSLARASEVCRRGWRAVNCVREKIFAKLKFDYVGDGEFSRPARASK